MKITDTTKSFLELFHSNKSATIVELQQYHAEYPEIFQTYFNGYCQWSEERLIEKTWENGQWKRNVNGFA